MTQTVTLRADDRSDALRLPPSVWETLGATPGQHAVLSFGGMRRFTLLETDARLPTGEICLPRRAMRQMHMPDYPVYELAVVHGELRVGPVIGLLVSHRAQQLTPGRLERLRRNMWAYPRLHGAIIVFALDGVDRAGRLIAGYCYNPGEGRFVPGVFPYPSVIYRTVGLSRQWKDHFLTAVEGGFFNYPYFNKWEMYRWFADDPAVGPYLPFTARYESPQQAEAVLRRCGALYIKPVFGLGGHGVVRARLEGTLVRFDYREENVNRRDAIPLGEPAQAWMTARFSGRQLLLQQALDLLQIGGRMADFRCVMQKDQAGRWVCLAVIGRRGRRGSVVSNISSGGSAFLAEELPRLPVPLPPDETRRLPNRLRNFAFEVCRAVDRAGLRCGTLGLDVGVDATGALWLIEINNRDPASSIALDVGDRELFRRIKAGPLFYAKGLAGFPTPTRPEGLERVEK